jgi:peroxidase
MAMGLAICFMMLIKLVIVLAKTPTTLNTTCVGDIGVLLQFGVYQESCPEAEPIILSWVQSAISEEPRMAASLLRLHFHDCFVNASQVQFQNYTYCFSLSQLLL